MIKPAFLSNDLKKEKHKPQSVLKLVNLFYIPYFYTLFQLLEYQFLSVPQILAQMVAPATMLITALWVKWITSVPAPSASEDRTVNQMVWYDSQIKGKRKNLWHWNEITFTWENKIYGKWYHIIPSECMLFTFQDIAVIKFSKNQLECSHSGIVMTH